jgi:hypothetical protein
MILFGWSGDFLVLNRRPICHHNNLDSEEDSIIVFLDEAEGTSKEDVPPFECGDSSGSDSDDENDPPAKQ